MFSWKKNNEVKREGAQGMTLEQVRIAMLQLLAEEHVNHHRMGVHYNYVVKNKLAEGAGYKNARDYFSKHLCDVSQASLTLYGAVAAAFSEEIARRFGVTCLHLLLIYKNVAEVEVDHDEPGDTLIEVPGDNGEVTPKRFAECSVEQMRRALRRKRKPASSRPLPAAELALVEQVRKTVMDHFAKGSPVQVEVRNHKGKAVVDFKSIPLEQLARLTEALLTHPEWAPPARPVALKEPPTA